MSELDELMHAFGEAGGDAVLRLLDDICGGKLRGYINVINLAELYYIIHRRSPKLADEKVRNLRAFGVEVVGVEPKQHLWQEAATIKSRSSLSLGDAFAAATAKACGGKLVTGGDPEFEVVGVPLLKIR